MALGSFKSTPHSRPMAEINTTPLVDVMLVLFVIVLVTAPVLTHTVSLELPKETAEYSYQVKDTHTLSIDAESQIFWNNDLVTKPELLAHFEQSALKDKDQPIDLYIDKAVEYGNFSWVLLEAQRIGLTKVGFVLEMD
jgi:biopolymer transport protein ExbD